MRLTILLLIAATFQVSARTYSQSVTLKLKNVSIEKAFGEIEKQSGFSFVYLKSDLKKTIPITIDEKNANLKDVLDKCFSNQPLTYTIKEKFIVVKEKSEKKLDPVTEGLNPRLDLLPPPNPDVTITVLNTDNQPLEGASITIKGQNKGIVTDINGRAVLRGVDPNATIIISFTGYVNQEVKLSNRGINPSATSGSIVIKLAVSTSELDQIQIIAYGQTTKRFNVGNIATVKAEDIEKQPVNNPLLALAGRVPGLTITQQNGIPGGPVTIRIQGQNSIAKGNDPLIIIDGVPYPSTMPTTGADAGSLASNLIGVTPSPLSFINPYDIERIDVLKDADATAIYGSRAANGALLITTKKGKNGASSVNINLQKGWGRVTHMIDMMNTRQYLDMRYEALRNDGLAINPIQDYDLTLWDTTRYTNWQKALIGNTAQLDNINASISGGTSNIQYFVGGTYQKQTTVFPISGDFNDERGSIHFNIGTTSTRQRFKMQFSGSYLYDNNHLPTTDLTQAAVWREPDAPALYNPDGTLNWAPNVTGNSTWVNPLVSVIYKKYKNQTNNLVSNLELNYTVVRGLTLKTSFGYNDIETNDFSASPMASIKPENRPTSQRTASYGSRSIRSWIIEPQVNYQKDIGNSKFDFLAGGTIQQNTEYSHSLFGSGYNNDEVLENPAAAATVSAASVAIYNQYKYNALFARLNYSLQNQYIVDIIGRRDGSSRFGAQSQFHNFWSLAGAWIFTELPLVKRMFSFLNFGKLKISYGTTGSDQIGDYMFLSLYNYTLAAVPYQNSLGLIPRNLPNPYLAWEETHKLQGGVELGLLKNRVLVSAIFARNRSSNQLLNIPLSSVAGFASIAANIPAIIQNTSWEFALNSINFRSNAFQWATNFNFTIPRNKLINFPDLASSSYASSLIIGQPLNVVQLYHFLGVDPASGLYSFEDNHGNATVKPSATDKTQLITTFPQYYGGLQNSFNFNGIQLDFLFQFVKQTGLLVLYSNGNLNPGQFSSGASNQPAALIGRWQKPDDITTIQKYSTTAVVRTSSSDAAYRDASYIRLKTFSLSYQLPQTWRKSSRLQTCKIYLQAQNMLTITNYQGMDPENQGVSALPPLRMVTLGVQVGF